MNRSWHTGFLTGALLLLMHPWATAEQITVETTECHGASGFSSFEERRLFKVQEGSCDNPNRPGERLYQILLHSNSPLTRYEVLWVTRDEAKLAMQQGRDNRDYRRKRLDQRNNVIVTVQPPATPRSAPPPANTTPPPGQPAGDTPPATGALDIEILDPPLMRSTNQVLSDETATERLIVGRIRGSSDLVSLSINGQPQDISDKGFFRRNVPVSGDRTHIEVVAVDSAGARERRDFWLVKPPKNTPPAGDGTPQAGDKNSEYGNYYALIIGINDYKHYRDLETAVGDAEAVEQVLRQQYGFTTNLLLNPTRYEILRTISDFRKKLTEKDNLLIYYAGHGEYDRVNLRGHWLPTDAESDTPANWISTIDITDSINRMSAKHILIVADSCYSGAMNRAATSDLDPGMSSDAKSKWLRVMASTRARTVLTSGGLAPVLDGGGSNHSLFATAFLNALRNNDAVLDGAQLFQEVRNQVSRRANEIGIDQVPEYAALKSSDHEFGDFLFVANTR